MLYVSHEVKDAPPVPKTPEYALAPGATKLPCVIETAINSDVEGYFTAKVSTNVYDTATGRHLLVPQGSTILGHDQSSTSSMAMNACRRSASRWRCRMGAPWIWARRRSRISKASPG